jgi:hypothetical protein
MKKVESAKREFCEERKKKERKKERKQTLKR